MTPAGWVRSTLSATPQTAAEVCARIPVTTTLTEVVAALNDLAAQGVAVRHEPAVGQSEPTWTKATTT